MNILQEAYYKRLAENERNVRFWEDYLRKLNSLDFSLFNAKLKVPSLVPVGSRILFRGELKHTNEVTVALGADYFVKCSLSQAQVLRQHRIKNAHSKLDMYNKEREYLENQMDFSKRNVYDIEGHEIVEDYSEEDDRAWRKKHRENVKRYKQNNVKEEDDTATEIITDDELWNRLEELELQEELDDELASMYENVDKHQQDSIVTNEEDDTKNNHEEVTKAKTVKETENQNRKNTFKAHTQTPKLELLQQVIDRQYELENKLLELKNKDSNASKTEEDLLSNLDDMEQLDELEDEMNRLDDLIQNENINENDDDSRISEPMKVQRRVSFADKDDSETLELTFKHSSIEPTTDCYDPKKGISKPSDIYQAYSHLFSVETTSILKKSKFESHKESTHIPVINKVQIKEMVTVEKPKEHETIVVKDVIEKDQPCAKLGDQNRPTSLFKKRRMLNKS